MSSPVNANLLNLNAKQAELVVTTATDAEIQDWQALAPIGSAIQAAAERECAKRGLRMY